MLQRVLIGLASLAALIAVRVFEDKIFYDPFIFYFKVEYLYENYFPDFDTFKMMANILLRYSINTLFSLLIIYQFFQDKSTLKFALLIYVFGFVLLAPLYMLEIDDNFSNGYLFAFYLRRFLIQPILLFLLVPAFFYQRRN